MGTVCIYSTNVALYVHWIRFGTMSNGRFEFSIPWLCDNVDDVIGDLIAWIWFNYFSWGFVPGWLNLWKKRKLLKGELKIKYVKKFVNFFLAKKNLNFFHSSTFFFFFFFFFWLFRVQKKISAFTNHIEKSKKIRKIVANNFRPKTFFSDYVIPWKRRQGFQLAST